MKLTVTRNIRIPDLYKINLYERCPDLGPRILFFSGGSALRKLSSALIRYTHRSIHIITPFDSGGSSAILRDAFHMPAVGDIRNRLLALADRSLHGHPAIFALFAHRLPGEGDTAAALAELQQMIAGHHRLVKAIPDPMRKIIRNHLRLFRQHMPDDFDLQRASIGNLILTGGYLNNQRHLDPVIFIFSNLVKVRGVVRPVISKDLHLVAALDNGDVLVGQHQITGKEVTPIQSRIKQVYLSAERDNPQPTDCVIRNKIRSTIQTADLICYPMGSFYSSLIANLLPAGVSDTIAGRSVPKLYIPNTTPDPEQHGLTLNAQVRELLRYLHAGMSVPCDDKDLLQYILVDTQNGQYPGDLDRREFETRGIQVLDYPLISPESTPWIDEARLIPVLLSLA